MKNAINKSERKPIWIALSEFYLDTELQESDFMSIARKVAESPYTLEEVKQINKYEVFPILQSNLLSVAGEWAGFDEEWLIKSIMDSLEKRNSVKKIIIEGSYKVHKWMCKDYWEEVEKIHNEIRANDRN